VDSHSKTQATLPNAHYFVQKIEWLYAIEASTKKSSKAHLEYKMDEMYKLYAEDRLVLINDIYFELLPSITLIHTGGHTPGHQIVKIQSNNEIGYYLGDLVPSELHLNNYYMNELDTDAIQAKKAKTLILQQAVKESASLFFYHSTHKKAGKLNINRFKKYQFNVLD
jgi:glyoxylase-like metal-dependent hydrolase (beta-lactamase superfamily II)